MPAASIGPRPVGAAGTRCLPEGSFVRTYRCINELSSLEESLWNCSSG